MSDIIDIIKSRRSVRNFSDKNISDEMTDKILEAVLWSPSWTNSQCWEIIVIKDQSVKEQIKEVITPKNPGTKAIIDAPVVLALCAKLGVSGYYNKKVSTKFGDWFMFDLGIAAQSICLCAHGLGLGTVIVGLLDHDGAKKVLNIPDGYEVVTFIPVGYPLKVPSAPRRKKISDFVHKDSFC